MTDPRWEQIKADILQVLQEVARRFEEDPTPTDGSFEAACKKIGIRSNVHVCRPDEKRGK